VRCGSGAGSPVGRADALVRNGASASVVTTQGETVLQKFFALSREKATQVMLKVHREGIGVCGVYPKDVAATKVEQVKSYAKQHQHPLQCVMEEM